MLPVPDIAGDGQITQHLVLCCDVPLHVHAVILQYTMTHISYTHEKDDDILVCPFTIIQYTMPNCDVSPYTCMPCLNFAR